MPKKSGLNSRGRSGCELWREYGLMEVEDSCKQDGRGLDVMKVSRGRVGGTRGEGQGVPEGGKVGGTGEDDCEHVGRGRRENGWLRVSGAVRCQSNLRWLGVLGSIVVATEADNGSIGKACESGVG